MNALPIPDSVVRRTRRFVERRATLDAVSAWLAEPAGRRPWFLVVGGPGTGKSALLAWLAGAGPAPADPALAGARDAVASAIRAVHFCDADGGRAAPSLDPVAFAQGIAHQLSAQFPSYFAELAQRTRVNVNITMRAGQVGQMIGPSFGDINVQSAASMFNLVVDALPPPADGRHVILVDALDEAELWRDDTKIGELVRSVSPHVLQRGIRFLMSSRPVTSIVDAFPPEARCDLDEVADADVATYVRGRLPHVEGDGGVLLDRIVAASAGNFLCAELLVDYLLEHPADAAELAAALEAPTAKGEMWKALDAVYGRFLQREFGADATSPAWTKGARPLLGTIAVAREKIAAPQLRWLLDPNPNPLEPGLVERALPRCVQYLDGALPDGPFALYHFSFREFLFSPQRAERFSTEEWLWHRYVTDRFRTAYEADWDGFHDDYGLRHLLGHLADAARLAPADKRGELVRRLVDLALSNRFLQAHGRDVDDPVALLADLDQVVDVVSLHAGGDAVPLLVRCTLGVAAYRREQLRPSHVFDLATRGDLAAAERRLGLFSLEDHWRQAALLLCAWAAPEPSRAALALCDGVGGESLIPPLPDLLERVRASLESRPAAVPGGLPLVAPAGVAEYILSTLKGIDPRADPSMLEFVETAGLRTAEEHADAEQLADIESLTSSDAGPQLRAEREAPFLVARARDDLASGNPLVREYVTMHAANSYVLYRNRSLWAILRSVVAHPDGTWVRERVRQIVEGALAGAMPDFRQSLPLTVLALRARAGDPVARQRWEGLLTRTMSDAEAVVATRGADGWAHLKRRLAVLIEIDKRVFSGTAIDAMARDARRVESAFAGFHAPACLTLAESLRVAGAPSPQINEALAKALRSAHNVQDPVFCARTTARVNAMITRWWPTPELDPLDDPIEEAERLTVNPSQARYRPVHVVGEAYAHRPRSRSMIGLPDHFRLADTLHALAEVVYQRPAVEFGRLNRPLSDDEPLPVGTNVVVPDGGFAAMIAARLAAELVARDDLDPLRRRHAAQRLVPVAAHDRTTLDTVLARLLLIDPGASVDWLDGLAKVVGEPSFDEEGGAAGDTMKFGPA